MLAFMSMGGTEILIILLIVLLLFGSRKLPELARAIGQAKKEFSKVSTEVTRVVEDAASLKEKK